MNDLFNTLWQIPIPIMAGVALAGLAVYSAGVILIRRLPGWHSKLITPIMQIAVTLIAVAAIAFLSPHLALIAAVVGFWLLNFVLFGIWVVERKHHHHKPAPGTATVAVTHD